MKRMNMNHTSTIALAIVLIVFGQSIAYYTISSFLTLFSVQLSFEAMIRLLQNMVYYGLVPQIAGALMILYIFYSTRAKVDAKKTKLQIVRFASLLFVFLIMFSSINVFTPIVRANLVATSNYYLDTPLPIASMYIGKYTNGVYFAVNGSNWDNFAISTNATYLQSMAMGNMTAGKLYLGEVQWDYANLAVSENCVVEECYNGRTRYFGNSADAESPYTISVGSGDDAGYYFAEGKSSIIYWQSTNASSIFENLDNLNVDMNIKVGIGTFTLTNSIPLNDDAVTLEGSGKGTIFQLADNANCAAIQVGDFDTLSDRTGIVLKDFTIDGNRDNNANGVGINVTAPSSTGVHIEGVRIKEADFALWCYVEVLHLYHNDITHCDLGTYIYTGNNWIEGNDLGGGLNIKSASCAYVYDNAIFDAPNNSTYFNGGFYYKYGGYLMFSDNHVIDNSRTGVVIETGFGSYNTGYNIIGNTIIENAQDIVDAGIKIQGGTADIPTKSVKILGNNIGNQDSADQDYGITLSGYIDDITIKNNDFFNNTVQPIYETSYTQTGLEIIQDNQGHNNAIMNNLANGVTPTFSTWDNNPSPAASITDEDWTTYGYGNKTTGGSGTIGFVTIDTGAFSVYTISVRFGIKTDAGTPQINLQTSIDGSEYQTANTWSTSSTSYVNNTISATSPCRYFRLYLWASAASTVEFLCYEMTAYQIKYTS